MTEQEWKECADPVKMQTHLFDGKVSFRKNLLWSCGCCRLAEHALSKGTELIEFAEIVADTPKGWLGIDNNKRADILNGVHCSWRTPHTLQADLLRDIFGSPFRPITIDESWLTWKDGTVRKMAERIYDERKFHDMPILADSLEEAGCTNADILSHCRGPGPHVRGCWVIDKILGKE